MENKKMEISEFYKKVFSDFKLKEKLEEKVKKITNEEDFKKLIREEIMPLMKRFKLNFSEEDLLNYEKETLKEISNEDLENVSGGVSVKSVLLAGGVLSMVLFSGAGLNANAMDNEPPKPPNESQNVQPKNNAPQQNNSNTDNSQNSGNNADKGDVSRSGKSDEKASVTESHEEGGANAVDSETVVPETAPPRPSASEGAAPETNNDTGKEKLKKAFIKELLKHNVDLLSLYDKKADGTFNDDAIAREINTVLGELKENNSVSRVNWEQTNCDATTKCIKLATEFGEVDVTFDEIRIFNLGKIRRAYGRNVERHLAGKWEVFKDQRLAGILSYEHSLLDPNKDLTTCKVKVYNEVLKRNEEKDGLVQKLTVKTPFGESDLWVYYYIDNGVLMENNRMIRYLETGGQMCDVSYEQIMGSFNPLSDDNKRKILQAVLDYLSIKAEQNDINELNVGNKTPLDVFNDKVKLCEDISFGDQKKGDMSDFAAILMFCENSFNRVMAGGKWERAFLDAAKNYLEANLGKKSKAINAVIKGYWLHVATGSEVPPARIFSKMATEKNGSLDQLQNWVNNEWDWPNVDVLKKAKNFNDLNLTSSSDGENQEQTVTALEHMVESTVKIGGRNYTLSQMVKCDTDIAPDDLIKTKYKYLNPTVLKIDGEDIPMQPSSSVSTTASDAEKADKK